VPERDGGANSAVARRARAGVPGAGASAMAGEDALRSHDGVGTIDSVSDDEATQLILETLFDIRVRVKEIHEVVVESEDDDEETEEDT
jgi:hypothetical protein